MPPETLRGSQSISRATSVLACLQEFESVSVSDVSRLLKLSPPTAHRALRALVAAGLLGQDVVTSRYHLGAGIAAVGALASRRLGYAAARPELQRLAESLGFTVTLGVTQGSESLVVEAAPAHGENAIAVEPGERAPIYACAMGKSVWAFDSNTDTDGLQALPLSLTRFTANTIVSTERLRLELADVRTRGWAMNDEELHTGVRGIGAPIVDDRGVVVAAVAVAAPSAVLAGTALADAVSAVKLTAVRLGSGLVGV